MPKKEPTTRMEKFAVGIQTVVKAQANAKMLLAGDRFLVGDLKDDFLPIPLLNYLKKLGWELDTERNMFSFKISDDA